MVGGVREVDVAELDRARADAASVVVDVREREEYASGHVPGAVSLPLSTLPARAHELPRDRPLYLICHLGVRSAHAARLLAPAAYDVFSVAGGTAAWEASGRQLSV